MLRKVQVREVAVAMDSMETLDLVQHHINREVCKRYLLLSDQQYWQLVTYLRECDHAGKGR